jgi:hypothetical protein
MMTSFVPYNDARGGDHRSADDFFLFSDAPVESAVNP